MQRSFNHFLLPFLFLMVAFGKCDAIEPSLSLGMDTRYVSEGRDNFQGQALKYVELAAEKGPYSLSFWHGQSQDNVLRESSLGFNRQWGLKGGVEIELNYTYLKFIRPSEDDHEIALSVIWAVEEDVGPSAIVTTVFSHQSSGFYHSVELAYTVPLGGCSVSPYVMIGANNSYVAGEHEGVDHYMLGVRASWVIDKVTFNIHASDVSPINRGSQDSLVNMAWGGVNLSFAF